MELTFNKVGETYEAEFNAGTDFNLHIEDGGRVALYKRTAGTGWDSVKGVTTDVYDYDVSVGIPKDYRVVCETLPSVAIVTMSE